jgi:hypothetical protein
MPTHTIRAVVRATIALGFGLCVGLVLVLVNQGRSGASGAVQVSMHDGGVVEGASGTTVGALTIVTLSAPIPTDLNVLYTRTGVTATAGVDFTGTATGKLVIKAGHTSGTITTPVVGDGAAEPDETFQLTITGTNNAGIEVGTATSTMTIWDDDAPGHATLTVHPSVVAEGDVGTTVSARTVIGLSHAVGSDTVVYYRRTDGTAHAPADYDGGDPARLQTLIIPAGRTSGAISTRVVGDSEEESDETFNVEVVYLNSPDVSLGTASATVTILDNDQHGVAVPGSIVAVNTPKLPGYVDVSWAAPPTNGGHPVTAFRIDRSTDGGSTFDEIGETPDAHFTTFQDCCYDGGTVLVYRMYPESDLGLGTAVDSQPVTIPTVAPPPAPTNVTVTATFVVGQVKVSWAAPADPGGVIDAYRVEDSLDGGTTWTPVSAGQFTTTTWTGTTTSGSNLYRVRSLDGAARATPRLCPCRSWRRCPSRPSRSRRPGRPASSTSAGCPRRGPGRSTATRSSSCSRGRIGSTPIRRWTPPPPGTFPCSAPRRSA